MHYHLGGKLYKIFLCYLRNKRETSGSSQVALYNLHLIIFCNKLNVKRATYIQSFRNFLRNQSYPSDRLKVHPLRRKNKCSITRVNSCILYMFRNRINNNLTLLRHTIYLYLFCIFIELTYNCWILWRNSNSSGKILDKLVIIGSNGHRRATEHIRRPYQDRIAIFLCKLFCFLNGCKFFPDRLINTKLI